MKKKKDRRSELERLRADMLALEMAEEEEILELRRKIAAGRRNILPQAQSSKNKGGSALQKFEVRHTSQIKPNASSDTLLASISHEYRPEA